MKTMVCMIEDHDMDLAAVTGLGVVTDEILDDGSWLFLLDGELCRTDRWTLGSYPDVLWCKGA